MSNKRHSYYYYIGLCLLTLHMSTLDGRIGGADGILRCSPSQVLATKSRSGTRAPGAGFAFESTEIIVKFVMHRCCIFFLYYCLLNIMSKQLCARNLLIGKTSRQSFRKWILRLNEGGARNLLIGKTSRQSFRKWILRLNEGGVKLERGGWFSCRCVTHFHFHISYQVK